MTAEFSDLVGQVITNVIVRNDVIIFETLCGDQPRKYIMQHYQHCCESVYIEDICGYWEDIIGYPILVASESSNSSEPPVNAESFTWTFYDISTIKGTITLRWLGTSNGFYSESVSFQQLIID